MRNQIKARNTANALLGLSKGGLASDKDDMDPEVARLLEGSQAEAPKPFVPGQNRGGDDEEDDEEVVSKRTKRSVNLPQEIRLSIR